MADPANEELSLVPPVEPEYKGAAWRARFLRAPKVALQLADREDFTAIQSLGTVRLGLKTGADSFFFLERMPQQSGEKELLSRRGITVVKGHGGWRGELASSDLRAAALNPHQLFLGDSRRFAIPDDGTHFYLYPQPGKPKHGLAEYVRVGELQGVHQGELVRSNGSDGSWYRQVRSLVTSEWALPYNSAYDYGAWHNPKEVVLNGRFVGVEPVEDVDTNLLGAALNSTFAAIGRLIEGVATGVEGAFDVGPPAARKIMVPDIRTMDVKARQYVLAALGKIKAGGVMVGAPLRDGKTHSLRWELDTALLVALGMTKGQAIGLLEQLYISYGRWRGNIEDVEAQMRANRRHMQATGQSRNQRPIEAAGRRIWEEIEHLIALYPKAYLPNDEIVELVNVPPSAAVPTSQPLFEAGVLHTKSKAIDLKSYERVRYVAMLRVLGLVGSVEVPVSAVKAGAIADLFEEEQLKFTKLATENATKYLSGAEAVKEGVEIARKHWHAACRKSALAKAPKTTEQSRLN